ncbi:Soluble lytic murein transglycosylase [Vibrio coralliirubri]|uniref:DUF1254 domain-containing protein n=1 Tax=Vibrio coralliirubri TaxID=1516159 RepID=UPI0006376CEC|nr:DUF1254 domain-containing protein [Vibrio coralliirubri]CDT81120.1 Soluble lytic murein transglycosylase [Vibrio coralliirubri]CDT86070.1 Soluble lytic murein transglycosylase [Vibrio coralliirubri]
MKKTLIALSLASVATAATASVEVTKENFVQAESTKYFNVQMDKAQINEFSHQRTMANVGTQDIIRMNQDTAYSIAVIDVSEGATITLPERNTYASALFIDINHLNPAVIYAGESITLTADDMTEGEHVYMLLRTGTKSYDTRGFSDMNAYQDSVTIEAKSANAFKGVDYDQATRAATQAWTEQEVRKGKLDKPWLAMGRTFADVDKTNHLLAAGIGWAALPAAHASYTPALPGQGAKGCSSVTFDAPPLDYANGGFFSLTTYDKAGWIAEENFALNNQQAAVNEDGTYTFHFQEVGSKCPEGAVNMLDVRENWVGIFRMYKPEDVQTIIPYTKMFMGNPIKTLPSN